MTVPTDLPEGYDLTVSPAIVVGSSSTTTDLVMEYEALGGLKVTLKPASSEIWLEHPTGGTKKLQVDGFLRWQILEVEIDHVKLVLGSTDADVTLEIYAVGHVRLCNPGKNKITFLDTTSDVDASFDPRLREIGTDTNWWMTADYKWSIVSNKLDAEETKCVSFFYNDRNEEEWVDKLVLISGDDLLIGGSPNEKLMRAFRMGFWSLWEGDLEALQRMAALDGRRGGEIDRWINFLGNVQRRPDEGDASLIARSKAELQRRLGGCTVDNLQDFIETFLSLSSDTITIVENKDQSTGAYVSAYLYIELDAGQLPVGIDVTEVEELLARMKGVGIKTEVFVTGGAQYDTAVYDTDIYSS